MSVISKGAKVYKANQFWGNVEKVLDSSTLLVKMKPGSIYKEQEKIIVLVSDNKLEMDVKITKTKDPFLLKVEILKSVSIFRKRAHERIHLSLLVKVDKREISATSIDISLGGMKFVLNKAMVEGKVIQLKFKLEDYDFNLPARIVGVKRVSHGFRYSVQFIDVQDNDIAALNTLLYEEKSILKEEKIQ